MFPGILGDTLLFSLPVQEIREVPSGHFTSPFVADLFDVELPKELHTHHGKDEDDDTEDKSQVGESANSVGHDCENVIEGFP